MKTPLEAAASKPTQAVSPERMVLVGFIQPRWASAERGADTAANRARAERAYFFMRLFL